MGENEIASSIIDIAIDIHKTLGPGLLESVCETILGYELKQCGYDIKRQYYIPLRYKGFKLEKAYVADIIINDLVILEIKSQENNKELHRMQLLSYLKISNKKLGLVLNFGRGLMMDGVSRVVNHL